jgi:hypothetical protein
MAIDQTISPWEAMEIEANETTPPERGRPRFGSARSFTRTAVLVVFAGLLILVLFPALLAAQAAVVV